MQSIILPKFNSRMEEVINNLFHSSGLPLHFNKTGNKQFTNYHRFSIIILFCRSGKSIRDFIDEFVESKWISWLGLKKSPAKSTLHDWLTMFDMKLIRKISRLITPEDVRLAAIDGTGIDSWQRSRHYEKRVGEVQAPPMPSAKADLFIDVDTKMILDFSLITHREHDVKIAERIFKRNRFSRIIALGDKGYDSENLHEIARANGIVFYAPVRKMNKRSLRKRPKGKYRRECLVLPDFQGMRSIVETVNSVLKRRQISHLRSKKAYMKKREFGWNVILYNIRRTIAISSSKDGQTFIFFRIEIYSIRTEPARRKI
jgi:hypothetical protein